MNATYDSDPDAEAETPPEPEPPDERGDGWIDTVRWYWNQNWIELTKNALWR